MLRPPDPTGSYQGRAAEHDARQESEIGIIAEEAVMARNVYTTEKNRDD